MNALVITLLRLGFLVLLWLFILFTVITVKNDVYGTKIGQRTPSLRQAAHSPAGRSANRTPPAQRQAPSPQWSLVVVAGPLTGTRIPLTGGTITVGRSPDSALVLDDGFASARHARFYNQGGYWVVEDLNSTNGTWVGSDRIYAPTRIAAGTPVVIGKTTLELRR